MPSPPEEEPQIPAGPRLQFESQAGGLLLQHAPAQLGNERARLGRVGAAAVDVGDYGAAGLRDAHIAAVGHVGAHGLAGSQAGALAQEDHGDLGAQGLGDGIHGSHTAVLDEEGGAHTDPRAAQPLKDGGQDVPEVGGH